MVYTFFPSSLGQIVVTCRKTEKPLVTWCKAGFLADLTTAPAGCEIQCNKAFKAEYEGDTGKYWECKLIAGKWVSAVRECFKPDVFDPVKKECASR